MVADISRAVITTTNVNPTRPITADGGISLTLFKGDTTVMEDLGDLGGDEGVEDQEDQK